MSKPAKRFWTEAETEMLRRHYADTRTEVLAEALGRPHERVLAKANAMGLKKSRELIAQIARERTEQPGHGSRAHRLKPGHVPANKGVKHPEGWAPGNMARSQFKPGHKPHTWVPVGSYRVSPGGALERKTSDDPGPSHVRWKPVHRLVWEAANGPVPPGHLVVFKPGRRTADLALITLDAVELLTRAEIMARNTLHQYPKYIVNATMLLGAFTRKINQRKKEEAKP
jgi:hypothetical protein